MLVSPIRSNHPLWHAPKHGVLILKNGHEISSICRINFYSNYLFLYIVSNLAELGTYGGNECIVAFARLNGVKVVIHQLNTPLWQVS